MVNKSLGRPKVYLDKASMISIYITEENKDLLVTQAKKEGLSLSKLLNNILNVYYTEVYN